MCLVFFFALTCTRPLAYRTQTSFTIFYKYNMLQSVDISGVPKRSTDVRPTAKQKPAPNPNNPPITSETQANLDPEIETTRAGSKQSEEHQPERRHWKNPQSKLHDETWIADSPMPSSKLHWKKLTCSTICRKHGISVELVWNHENSTLIPYCGSFKFHITYAEAGYQLWN